MNTNTPPPTLRPQGKEIAGRTSLVLGVSVLLFVGCLAPAPGLTIRDDVAASEYIRYAESPAFQGARFTVSSGSGSASAVLIAPDVILFSAHLLYQPDGTMKQGALDNLTTYFYQDSAVAEFYQPALPKNVRYWRLDPQSVELDPAFLVDGGPNHSADFALARIVPGSWSSNGWTGSDSVLPIAAPIPLLDRHLAIGDAVTVLGVGGTGTGSTGATPAASDFAHPWRAATNVIEATYGVDSVSSSFDFDAPEAYRYADLYNIGSPEPTALEGAVFLGDSGGAWLVQTPNGWALGATTTGNASVNGPLDASYGDISAGTDVFGNADWLIAHGATFAVPEPSVAMLLLFGSFACIFAARSNSRPSARG